MTPQQLSNMIGDVQSATILGNCYTCNKHNVVKVERVSETEISISGGSIFNPPDDWEMGSEILMKCESCHKDHPQFGRPTEVYSRIVGYMRPLKNWNDAKRNEFEMRTNFNVGSI